MARLKVRLRGRVVSEIPLAETRQYIGGRKDGCDIHLQGDKNISREHFKVFANNGVWSVEVLSRFGEVLLGGEKVASATLDHATVFSVPPYEFEFLMTSGDAGAVVPEGEQAPVAADSTSHDEDGPIEKTVVGVAPSVPYIKMMDSQGEPRELIRLEGGDTYLAGRDSSCNIHIKDQRVSRRQFEIRKIGSNYSIIDLGSVNGTLLNGNPVSTNDPVPLKSGDAISVLENYLYFELHDPNFKSRLELVSLQPPPDVMNPLLPAETDQMLPPVPAYVPPSMAPMAYDPAMHQQPMGLPPQMPLPPSSRFDFQKHRLRLILAAVAVVVIAYTLFDNQETHRPGSENLGPMRADPLSKLTPEQKKLVKDTLQLAKSYYMQGKYEFAKSELVKMTELVPEFDDSRELMRLIEEALYVQQQQRKQDELEKARAEQEEKIQKKVAECQKIITPSVTKDAMENCLVEVIPFNPGHPGFAQLFAEVDRLHAERQAQEARSLAAKAEIARLKGMYAKAKGLDDQNKPLAAMEAYGKVSSSSLPDPGGLKGLSRDRIAQLRKQVNQKTATYQQAAEAFAGEGKLKDAILSLREAKRVDPQNPDLDLKIADLRQKLQEQMLVIYQEGVLEESFGNVDGDETKPGAKQKWRRIIQQDIPDGEYYKKAYLKLKKYGTQ